jgi:hypothetical protein
MERANRNGGMPFNSPPYNHKHLELGGQRKVIAFHMFHMDRKVCTNFL